MGADVFARLESIDSRRIKPGLARIEPLLDALEAPHLEYPTAIVGGTNGKGSVAAMLAAIGRAADLRVGCYVSPHLVSLEERFLVDGFPITRAGLAAQLEAVFATIDELVGGGRIEPPSYFEVLTAVAFRYFAEANVDLAVLEVGLGGRWDATNVTRPRVAVITSVSVDHTDFLGGDLPSIAAEKAAIIPASGIAVTSPQSEDVLRVVRRHCDAVGATLWESEHYPVALRKTDDRLRLTIDFVGRVRSYVGLDIGLPGRHQVDNARCAILAAEALDRRRLRIGSDAIWAGLRGVEWPGRCEWLGDTPPVLLDAAHNPAAARVFAAYLTELRDRGAFERLHLVFGMLADKDAAGVAGHLFPLADSLVVTRPPSPRALEPERLLEIGELPEQRRLEPQPAAALEAARDGAGPRDLVCVTGSSYLVGAVRSLLLGPAD